MAEISKLASNGHHTFYLTVEETYVDNVNNRSTVSWSFGIESVNSSWDFYIIGGTITINMNGEQIFNEYKQRDHNAKGRTIWASGTKNITHNSDGSKYLEFSFTYSQSSGLSSWTPGNASNSGGMNLTNIPRYFTSTPTLTLSSKTETTATFIWSTSENASRSQYRINNGGWVDVETGINKKSGSFTVSGLSPNTSYTIYGDFMRYDSGQWAQTKPSVGVVTYDYPHPITINDFTIGYPLTIEVYNPLGRTYNLQLISNNNGGEIGSYDGTSETLVGFNDEESKNKQYASIPNFQSGTYYAKVTYDGKERTLGNKTYSILLNTQEVIPQMPDNYTFPCKDVNEKTTALTGDNYKVILGYSTVQTTIPVEYKASANKGATMSYYELSIGSGELFDKKNYSDTEDIVLQVPNVSSEIVHLYVVDSRGSTLSLQRNMIPIHYTNPMVTVSEAKAIRDNNGIGENVTLNFSGTYWNQSFGAVTNAIKTLKYKFKKTDDTTWSQEFDILENIVYNNNEFSYNHLIQGDLETLGFDIAESYNIEVTYGDELETKTFALTLGSGSPNLAIAKNGVSVKAPYDNNIGGAMQVHGDLVLVDGKVIGDHTKNAITVYRLDEQTVETTYEDVYFQYIRTQAGSGLRLQDGNIIIGAGIKQVKVSGAVWVDVYDGYTWGTLLHNGNAISACMFPSVMAGQDVWRALTFPTAIIDVNEGDIIKLGVTFSVADSRNRFAAFYAGSCYLTVEEL